MQRRQRLLSRRPYGRRSWARALSAIVLAAVAVLPFDSADAVAVRSGSVTGWVPYWETTMGTQAVQTAADLGLFTEVSPFWFTAQGATTVTSVGTAANLATVTRAARAKGVRVIPSVTDGTGKLVMQTILADPATRSAHVDTLVALVLAGVDQVAFDGIDIDYEGFAFADARESWPTTQPLWLAFVKELADKLHAHGKLLSITVPAIWTDARGGEVGYTVYGPWSSITASADRLRLMVYDWSVGAPGPIAPLSWVRNVLAYVRRAVPAADLGKVWLGVPAYGRSWARVTGECPPLPPGVTVNTTSVQSVDAAALAASHGAAITEVKDAAGNLEGERTFGWNVGTFTGTKIVNPAPGPYEPPPVVADEIRQEAADPVAHAPAVRVRSVTVQVTCSITRVVYFPDTASIVQRAQLAQAAGLGGTVVWALGFESPDLWQALAAS